MAMALKWTLALAGSGLRATIPSARVARGPPSVQIISAHWRAGPAFAATAHSLFSTVVAASAEQGEAPAYSTPKISIVRHPVSLDGSPIDAATKPSDKFAVVEFSGTQYKLTVVYRLLRLLQFFVIGAFASVG
jgi:polyisoprenoid-binding protein YceI